ncbi:hypothetical protein SAMN05216489_05694 [Streptomyces sp. 3213]|uniref:MmyB family transcriptional regulator n=1 Tax=Streptomyces sp. 3213.3 TaxID=1855348 RepID=UPI0008949AED|nr:hypothetical protein [Streptomyces sp. 3213.3]SEE15845.1 hypothetical protein SAMN05216489_05694 [Streptomyces sp. 3213] [Streptomyces sp. 3213.3]
MSHLHDRAGAARRLATPRRSAPERAGDATRQLLAALGDAPAIVLGRRSDVLAWNPTGHALFAGHLDVRISEQADLRPNMARARNVAGTLRLAARQHPDDPGWPFSSVNWP